MIQSRSPRRNSRAAADLFLALPHSPSKCRDSCSTLCSDAVDRFPATAAELHPAAASSIASYRTEKSCQQFVENHAQRINVGARIDVVDVGVGLLRTHVSGCTQEGSTCVNRVSPGTVDAVAFARPKSMMCGIGLPINFDNQDIRGLQIAMNDGFLMGVLHAVADLQNKWRRSRIAIFLRSQ